MKSNSVVLYEELTNTGWTEGSAPKSIAEPSDSVGRGKKHKMQLIV